MQMGCLAASCTPASAWAHAACVRIVCARVRVPSCMLGVAVRCARPARDMGPPPFSCHVAAPCSQARYPPPLPLAQLSNTSPPAAPYSHALCRFATTRRALLTPTHHLWLPYHSGARSGHPGAAACHLRALARALEPVAVEARPAPLLPHFAVAGALGEAVYSLTNKWFRGEDGHACLERACQEAFGRDAPASAVAAEAYRFLQLPQPGPPGDVAVRSFKAEILRQLGEGCWNGRR